MKKPQLFCFTYAGGNTSFFDQIEKDLTDISLVKLEYAGRGSRHKEPFYNGIDDLADDMFSLFKEIYTGGEYGLFGYSMGTISVTEVVRRIVVNGIKLPSYVFLAAHEPIPKPKIINGTKEEVNSWIKKHTISFGAVPNELADNRVFWKVYLPIYKADYTLVGDYDFSKVDLKIDIPLVVFYSESDTRLEDMKLWQNYFIGECEYHRYEGKHFFIKDHHKEMAQIIKRKLGVI